MGLFFSSKLEKKSVLLLMCNLHARISVRLFEVGLRGEEAFLNYITENGSIKPSHRSNDMIEIMRINS